MKRACVIGWPIEHSRSPIIHGYWLKKYGIGGDYSKVAVKPNDVAQFLRALAANGLSGCNVTVPHKEAAFAIADIKDPSAIAVGAANTIWLEGDKIACANTDTYGFMTHLTSEAPAWKKPDRPVAILGAGGAARAIITGFLDAGVSDVRVFNRSHGRAQDIAAYFGSRVTAEAWSSFETSPARFSVVVNTTTLGMNGANDVLFGLDQLPDDCVVADIVYVPLETGLLQRARGRGLKTVDGLGMLLHQAVPGFDKWFGIKPEVTSQLRALIEADIRGAS